MRGWTTLDLFSLQHWRLREELLEVYTIMIGIDEVNSHNFILRMLITKITGHTFVKVANEKLGQIIIFFLHTKNAECLEHAARVGFWMGTWKCREWRYMAHVLAEVFSLSWHLVQRGYCGPMGMFLWWIVLCSNNN